MLTTQKKIVYTGTAKPINNTGGSFIYSEELKVLPAVMAQITAGGIARGGVSSAAALIMMIPPILIFLLSQKSVIQTMSTSGLK